MSDKDDKGKITEIIDINEMNALINKAVLLMKKSLGSSRVTAREKREISRDLVKKAMPSGVNLTHDVGDSFLDLVKSAHTKTKKRETRLFEAKKKAEQDKKAK